MSFYLMQARSSSSLALVTWQTPTPDWLGSHFPGPGSPSYIAATLVRLGIIYAPLETNLNQPILTNLNHDIRTD